MLLTILMGWWGLILYRFKPALVLASTTSLKSWYLNTFFPGYVCKLIRLIFLMCCWICSKCCLKWLIFLNFEFLCFCFLSGSSFTWLWRTRKRKMWSNSRKKRLKMCCWVKRRWRKKRVKFNNSQRGYWECRERQLKEMVWSLNLFDIDCFLLWCR